MKHWFLRTVFLGLLVCFSTFSMAENVQTARRVEEEKLSALDVAPSHVLYNRQGLWVQSGAWMDYSVALYRETDHNPLTKDSLTSSRFDDVRIWQSLSWQTLQMKKEGRRYGVYARERMTYVERSGMAPGAKADIVGPRFDQLYSSIEWKPWKLEAGRRQYSVGKGIAYNGVYDGFQLNYLVPGWNGGIFASQTLPRAANLDTSLPYYDNRARRYFLGIGLGYAGFKGQQIYSYYVVQKDGETKPIAADPQDFRYDSQYVGLGAKGDVGSWRYWLEAIRETGTSRSDTSNERSAIHAWGFDAVVDYRTDWRSRAVFSTEYAWGSGDGERISVTNTLNGNWSKDDKGFAYFGYFPTGVAFSGMLSNLHMLRGGFAFYPFAEPRWTRGIRLVLNGFRYWKDQPAGGVDDFYGWQKSYDVGVEGNIRLEWKLNGRLFFAADWGRFFPGDAFPTSNRHFSDVAIIRTTITF